MIQTSLYRGQIYFNWDLLALFSFIRVPSRARAWRHIVHFGFFVCKQLEFTFFFLKKRLRYRQWKTKAIETRDSENTRATFRILWREFKERGQRLTSFSVNNSNVCRVKLDLSWCDDTTPLHVRQFDRASLRFRIVYVAAKCLRIPFAWRRKIVTKSA